MCEKRLHFAEFRYVLTSGVTMSDAVSALIAIVCFKQIKPHELLQMTFSPLHSCSLTVVDVAGSVITLMLFTFFPGPFEPVAHTAPLLPA